jgi:hypothetical protein
MIDSRSKNQQDVLFYSQFISLINLYMFRANLLLVTRRYLSVYTAVGICHTFVLIGYWQDRLTAHRQEVLFCIYRG